MLAGNHSWRLLHGMAWNGMAPCCLQDDDDNPVWDANFFFTVPMSASKSPAGVILLELWDNNTFKVQL
jgi:hypothetical protein